MRRPAITSGSDRIKRAALILILACAAFLRLYRITDLPPGLYRDEAANGVDARQGFALFFPANNGREGLFIDVQRVFVTALGSEPWVLRLPAALFGILTVGAVYLLGAEIFGDEVGLLAAFFLATSFWHINFSRIGLRAIAAPCFLTWALYLLLTGLRRGRQWLVVAAGLIYGLGFYTYLAYRATPLLLAFVLWQSSRADPLVRAGPPGPAPARSAGIFAIVAALTVAPLALYFLTHPAAFAQYPARISVLRHPHPAWEIVLNLWRTARMFFLHGDPNWRHNVAWRAELYWPVAALFAAGVVLPFKNRAIPLLWLLVAAIPVILADDVMPHALRSLLMTPAVFLLAGVAAREVWTRLRIPTVAVAAVALWLCWEPYHTYFDVWARDPNVAAAFDIESVGLAQRIRQTPGEKVVLVPAANPMLAEPVKFLAGDKNVRYLTADVEKPQLAEDEHKDSVPWP
jgi:4-amino-4-deoxy-L-arabinose transferase-like glycosyltransferase